MKLSELGLKLLIITLIAASVEADDGRESLRSRTGNSETTLRGGYSHRGGPHNSNVRRTKALRVRRPNETPIKPGRPARRPAALPSSTWGGPQAQRELLFVSPERFMQTRPRTSGTDQRRGHFSNASPQRTRRPSTTYRPTPEASARGRLETSQSQRKETFVSPPHDMRTRPRTAETDPRGGHSTQVRSPVTSRVRGGMRPNGTLSFFRSAARRPPATHRAPGPEASARNRLEISQSQRELKLVSPPRDMRTPDTAAAGRRGHHSQGARRRGTQSRRKSKARRPNETPIRPGTPARRPAALPSSVSERPRFSQGQQELLFVSPERFMEIKGRPRTVGTNPREGHSSRASPQGMNLGRKQASGGRRRPNRTPMPSAPRIYLVSSGHTTEASAPSAVIRILTS